MRSRGMIVACGALTFGCIVCIGVYWQFRRQVLAEARDYVGSHLESIGSGDIDSALMHYSPTLMDPPRMPEGLRSSLTGVGRLTSKSLYHASAEIGRGPLGLGWYVRLFYQTAYTNVPAGMPRHYQEDFLVARQLRHTNMTILRHGFD